jgi:hypothetical protein
MESKRLKRNWIIVGALITLSSCTHYYYAPNAHNVPMLKEKSDTKAVVAISSGDEFTGVEAQFARAVSDKIGIMANFISASGSDEGESGRGTLIEGGVGYFTPLAKQIQLETYGGIGFGGVKNYYDPGTSKVKFSRVFLQSGVGFISRNFDVVISTRLAHLNYNHVSYNLYDDYEVEDLLRIQSEKSYFLIEPALTLRAGWEDFKFQLQYVHSNNSGNSTLQQETENISMGIFLDISPKK